MPVAVALVAVSACSSTGSTGATSASSPSSAGAPATAGGSPTTVRATATTMDRTTGTTAGSGGTVRTACADQPVTRDTTGGGESVSYGSTLVVDCATPHDAGLLIVDLVPDPDPDGPGGDPGLADACQALLDEHPPQGLPAGAEPSLTEKEWSADVSDEQNRGTLTCTVLFGDVEVTGDPLG